jgi:hypothetical protein
LRLAILLDSAHPALAMPPSRLGAGLALLLLIASVSPTAVLGENSSWNPDPYSLGHGLNFPQQGLVVGGYLSLYYSDLQHQDAQFSIRDLSLFVSKTLTDRWHLFSEVEIGDALRFSRDGVSRSDAEFDLERLYADYRATREANFRFGKFLTPVGRWNVIHADPLVWTADRPLTTTAAFARHATGAMLYGDADIGGNSLDYSLYVDDSELLDPAQKNELAFEDDTSGLSPHNAFKHAAGGRVAYHFMNDAVHVGVSYVRFRMSDLQERQELFGADALLTVKRMELSGEWVYRNSLGSTEPDEYGGFLQAVLPLPDRFYLVGRWEKYRVASLPPSATIDTLGITYRPHEAVSIKLEYRDGKHNEIVAPSGWLGSLAILF